MGKRKKKRAVTGKEILTRQVGQRFAEVIMRALAQYAEKVAQDNNEGVPSIILNRGAGSFAIVSDDSVQILNTIQTPVAIIKSVTMTDELARKLWGILLKYGEEIANGMSPAILLNTDAGEFIAIEIEDEDETME
jgi:hypothetical protein